MEYLIVGILWLFFAWLFYQRLFWESVLAVSILASAFACIASVIHLQIFAAIGFLILFIILCIICAILPVNGE